MAGTAYQTQSRQTLSRRSFLSCALTLAAGAALGLALDGESASAQEKTPAEPEEPPI
jgi:hypothetical protein